MSYSRPPIKKNNKLFCPMCGGEMFWLENYLMCCMPECCYSICKIMKGV